jgi:tRNA1Val (adenine37-N6)-methyltransferase
VALADFAQAGATDTVLDLCSGCGVVPILMFQRFPFRHGVGVELDAELATLARRNVTQFHLEDQIHIVQGDIRCLDSEDLQVISPAVSFGRFDVITANPPYWPADRGRLNPNLQKAAARHEIFLRSRGAAVRRVPETRRAPVPLSLESRK